jgi:hypothetical protein
MSHANRQTAKETLRDAARMGSRRDVRRCPIVYSERRWNGASKF